MRKPRAAGLQPGAPPASRLFWRLGLVFFALLLASCGLSGGPEVTPTAAERITPSATAFSLPDLTIPSAVLLLPGAACIEPGASLQVQVTVANQGQAASGAFSLVVNEFKQVVSQGLAPGESRQYILPAAGLSLSARVDVLDEVVESREDNNVWSGRLPEPAASLRCTPTPAPQPAALPVESVLLGHSGRVACLAFSPDGRLLASGGVDNTLRLWRVPERNLLRTMSGHPFPVTQVAFSPNGQQIATGSDDSLVRLWRVANASLEASLVGHAERITGLVYAPSGSALASSGLDYTVRVWRVSDGRLLQLIDEGMSEVLSLVFAPNGASLAWGESNGRVRIWQVSNRRTVQSWQEADGAATQVAFSPTGDRLAAGFADGTLRLWMVGGDSPALTLGYLSSRSEAAGGAQQVSGLSFSPDGRYLAAAARSSGLAIWRLRELASESAGLLLPAYLLTGHQAALNEIAFSPDGRLLAAAGDDGGIYLWALPQP